MTEQRVIYQGRRFRVERCGPRSAEGATESYEIIRHSGAAVVLPLLEDGRVVLIRNERVAVGRELLELPAGCLEPSEPPLECARRELAEETGYVAEAVGPLLSFYSTPGMCDELLHAFVATGLRPGAVQHEPGERIHVVAMDYDEALRGIRDGRIVDAKTIATLLYYDRFVRKAGTAV